MLESISFSQRQRLAYIDFCLLFKGAIHRQDLITRFEVGLSAGSRDFTLYKELAPKNLVYSTQEKRYFQTENFNPLFEHDAKRTLVKLANDISDGFDAIGDIHFPVESASSLNVPDIFVVAKVVQAIVNNKAISVIYTSLSSGSGARELVPHSIVDNGQRWHVRAFDRKSQSFRDFVLTRISKVTYMPLLDALTLNQQDTDSSDVMRLRNQLYGLLGMYADSEMLVKKSEKLAKQYIADTTSVPSGIAATAIAIATKNSAKENSEKWFADLLGAFKKAQLPNVKRTLLYSMRFDDKELVFKMLDLALTDNVTPANALYMVTRVARNLDDHTLLYQWLNENKEALLKKMPDYHVSSMPEYVSSTCSVENLNMANAFYADIMSKHEGMSRGVEIMQDESQQCLRLKDAFQQDFDNFLASYQS